MDWHTKHVDPDVAVLYAVPNGERRGAKRRGEAVDEGMLAGVADLHLITFNTTVFIEVKLARIVVNDVLIHDKSYQNSEQKAFQAKVERFGHAYRIPRSLREFVAIYDEFGIPYRPTVFPIQLF